MNLERDVPLAPLTTLGIGGPARYFVHATTVDELREAIQWARDENLATFILGGGSNLLVADAGFDGLVIQIDLRGITVESEDEFAMVKAGAGEPWDAFVRFAVNNGWAGIECLSGIPGLTGATPIQNVGAYGQDVSETIARVEVLDRSEGIVKWLTNWDCRFGYRSSLFKNVERDRYVVLSVTYRLKRNGSATVRYTELLKEVGSLDDLRGVRDAVIAIRRRKGMVLDPNDPDTRSDGSFFMNPIITAAEYDAFAKIAPDAPHYPASDGSFFMNPVVPASLARDGMPSWPNADGTVKLSAAWLIEHAGFHKGFVHGRAGISSKHTLAIINRNGASAAEVLELVRMIQSKVRERFGIELQPEPNFIGF
jgi:UDP-N-acetylmuramate dehydrogenase